MIQVIMYIAILVGGVYALNSTDDSMAKFVIAVFWMLALAMITMV